MPKSEKLRELEKWIKSEIIRWKRMLKQNKKYDLYYNCMIDKNTIWALEKVLSKIKELEDGKN